MQWLLDTYKNSDQTNWFKFRSTTPAATYSQTVCLTKAKASFFISVFRRQLACAKKPDTISMTHRPGICFSQRWNRSRIWWSAILCLVICMKHFYNTHVDPAGDVHSFQLDWRWPLEFWQVECVWSSSPDKQWCGGVAWDAQQAREERKPFVLPAGAFTSRASTTC